MSGRQLNEVTEDDTKSGDRYPVTARRAPQNWNRAMLLHECWQNRKELELCLRYYSGQRLDCRL